MYALLAFALLAVPCAQDASQPSCVTVPQDQAAEALTCVVADLPACLTNLHADAQTCDVDKHEIDEKRQAAVLRGDRLQALLDTVAAPPVVPWYSRPEFVAPTAVALTVATLVWAGRL